MEVRVASVVLGSGHIRAFVSTWSPGRLGAPVAEVGQPKEPPPVLQLAL